MADVFVNGQRVSLDPSKAIGKGGEADIFKVGRHALKVYKDPKHPDYTGMPDEQRAAKLRIAEHQHKLPDFPKRLPPGVVSPTALATKTDGSVIGYTMTFLKDFEVLMRWTDRTFRAAVDPNDVLEIFRNLHKVVDGIHRCTVTIGDFNDLNVMVHGTTVQIIDADSFQFGKYPCRTFTAKFVDPTLCDPQASAPELAKPHNPYSDWYAFAVMLMQCLLYVDPYGGVYRPADHAKRIPHQARPLKRVTVFDPEVKYPKPAIPYDRLPDDLLDQFHRVFEKDERGEFPFTLIESTRWTTCSTCGEVHARSICPACQTTPTRLKQVTTVRGAVTATRIFSTKGTILCAAWLDGQFRWLYNENNGFRLSTGDLVANGQAVPTMRFRLTRRLALIAKDSTLAVLGSDKNEQRSVDCFQNLPIIDANGSHYYWMEEGQLMTNGVYASKRIGSVLRDQTLFWVGENFGFGFYRAGEITRAFVFETNGESLNDSVKLSPIRGQLVDATCSFSHGLAWLFLATQEQGQRIHRCVVINSLGLVMATGEAVDGDGTWLGTLRGKAASQNFLLAPTDDGVVRVEIENGRLIVVQEFPDTEPFVSSASLLFAGADGLYAVDDHEVHRLQIRQATT